MSMGCYSEFAPQLVQLGYDVTPCLGKRPKLKNWNKRPETARDFEQHGDANIGIICGGKNKLIGVDVDVTNPFASNEVQKLAGELLGEAPRRVGKPPKFLLVFCCKEPLRKIRSSVFEIDGDDCALEVLADGQQFVAFGIHPDTQESYYWPDDTILDYQIADLSVVTPEQLLEFLKQAERILAPYGTRKGRSSDCLPKVPLSQHSPKKLEADSREIGAALRVVPNDDVHYDDWIETLHAIKGAVGDVGYELAHSWSSKSSKYDATETDRAWESIDSVHSIGAGSIFHLAAAHGFDLAGIRRPSKQVEKTKKRQQVRRPIQSPREVFEAEPIEWLVEGLIPKIGVGLLSGASGSFKSYIAGYLALCISAGRPVSDRCSTTQGPALYTAHEGRIGMARRLVAAVEYYDAPEADIGLWEGITLASDTDVTWLLKNHSPQSAVFVDTLSKATPGIDENSNSEMALAIERAYELADAWECFVTIIAHTGKDEARGTRGASALKANVDTVLSVRRAGQSKDVSVVVEKQKDADDDMRLDFKMQGAEVVHNGTGEIYEELVPVITGSNPSADERIRNVLAETPDLNVGELVSAVTKASKAARYRPVTREAVKVALGRAVERGTVIKNGRKYKVREIIDQ